jgi:hypothetical protein
MSDDHGVPGWFVDTDVAPPFATGDEITGLFNEYLSGITEPQFHGIRLGEGEGEVVVLREQPGIMPHPLTNGSDTEETWLEWTTGHKDTPWLARRILDVVTGDGEAGSRFTADFAERIVGRLNRHEWTLKDADVLRWVEVMKMHGGR